MKAAVYRGRGLLRVEEVPVPEISDGELLVRVECCGICHTDLKKIEYGLLPPPRIFGHEIAGVVERAGSRVSNFREGDRVVVFHHVPCLQCFYCHRKLYAQCPVYKRVGVTAGFEPAGGGFAQYVRVMDWIVEKGIELIPEGVSFERAVFVEPLNTCLKAVHALKPQAGEVTWVIGQGPIGLMFTGLLQQRGVRVVTTDYLTSRRELSLRFGAAASFSPEDPAFSEWLHDATEGRGADAVIVAASGPAIVREAIKRSRPGARVLLFAQTSRKEVIELCGADICVDERVLLGSYSASIDLQKESARIVFENVLPFEALITHRFSLDDIEQAVQLALMPNEGSLKVVVCPQR